MNFGGILACISYILTDKKKGRNRLINFKKILILISHKNLWYEFPLLVKEGEGGGYQLYFILLPM